MSAPDTCYLTEASTTGSTTTIFILIWIIKLQIFSPGQQHLQNRETVLHQGAGNWPFLWVIAQLTLSKTPLPCLGGAGQRGQGTPGCWHRGVALSQPKQRVPLGLPPLGQVLSMGEKSHTFHRKRRALAECCLWFCFSLRMDITSALGWQAVNAKQPERAHYRFARGLQWCKIQKSPILGIFTAWQVLLILFWGCQLSTCTQYTELRQ